MDVQLIRLKLLIVVEPDDGGWHAYCPDLKGLHVAGETQKEALANATEAAKLYIGSLLKHNEPIPVGVQDGQWSMKAAFQQFIGNLTSPSRERVQVQLAVPA